MAVIAVPYFLDEYLPDLDLVLRPDVTVAVPLPDGDAWDRLSALNAALAEAICRALDRGCPVVVCGDCCDALAWSPGCRRQVARSGSFGLTRTAIFILRRPRHRDSWAGCLCGCCAGTDPS